MSFLTAEWRRLLLLNYLVDPELLQRYVPAHTELDFWKGNCYVSVVGFLFKNTKVLGMKIPFHINFEEVNLRFYVKHLDDGAWKRGVVFVKEIVPKAAITFVANTLYKEHYETWPMKYSWQEEEDQLRAEYQWRYRDQWQSIWASGAAPATTIPDGGEVEFITQHFWGYTQYKPGVTYEYEVTHPRWLHYPVNDYGLEMDFGAVYGPDFRHLNQETPHSVMLAEGSPITVEGKRRIS